MPHIPDRNRESLRVERTAVYRALDPVERAVLQLLSVTYEPISIGDLGEAMGHAKIPLDAGRKSGEVALRKIVQKLKDKHLIHVERHGQFIKCDSLIVEIATRDSIWDGRFEEFAKAADKVALSTQWHDRYYTRSFRHAMRLVRLRLYRGQAKELWSALEYVVEMFKHELEADDPLVRICNNPFDGAWFATLPAEIREPTLYLILENSVTHLQPADDAFHHLEQTFRAGGHPDIQIAYRSMLSDQLVWRGRISEAADIVRDVENIDSLTKRAFLALLTGEFEESLAAYDEAVAALRQTTGKRKSSLWTHHDVFYAVALVRTGELPRLKQAHELLKRNLRDNTSQFRLANTALLELVESSLGLPPSQLSQKAVFFPGFQNYSPVDLLIKCLTSYWMDSAEIKQWINALESQQAAAADAGYVWFAAEMDELLARIGSNAKKVRRSNGFFIAAGVRPLADAIRKQEAWERSLDALAHIADADKTAGPDEAELRIAWRLAFDGGASDLVRLEAREVKRRTTGAWTKGKAISLKRLATERETVPYLTPHDLEICDQIVSKVERSEYYGTPRVYYHMQTRGWLALAGHPMVFWDDGTRVEVTRGEPELHVVQEGNHVSIQLVPPLHEDRDICLVRDGATRLKIIECTPAHRRIAAVLKEGLRVPVEQKARVLDMLTRVTSLITVHSGIGGGLENVPEVPADARPHVILVPSGAGLRVQVMVQPLAQGAYYRPGAGGETVLAEVNGQHVQTRRNLKQEQEQAGQVISACGAVEGERLDTEWIVEDPEQCLELLERLHELGDAAVVEWPQGEKMRVSHRASFGNFQVKVVGGGDWFEASGQLRFGDDNVLGMRQLLELLDQTQGRFIPLGEGEFLSLTKEFRKRLDEFRALTDQHGDGLRFHPLAAPAVEGLFDCESSFSVNKAWKEHLKRFRDAQAFDAAVPSTLRATLRDYQVEGYQWMARLARWGAGACLADDMGLGKTVQALALMLSHASEGPMLVIAPTSVCLNWIGEAQRFAPTLNPILFGAGDRQAALDSLKPFDMLVCSYGLLHQEAEKLAAVRWRVAVLDEAQAIKNMTTRRSKAAMNLNADFRLITTGTPIENHLGELWNLFRFINPGLLRSLDQFNHRFAVPIEKHQDREARARLKKIIQPFILRRVKEQVLEELPSRTEILLHVEFSEEEAAFYEALRRQAVEKIAGAGGTPGQKHLRILAEIMRLRRACCNAKLVTPEIAVPSSKLAVFLNLVDELLENRHKALVFSQFVDHLSILREALDERKIAYQYLDGSTPQRVRKTRVDAFQAGEGDLFLISLKAGGLGLNLTAADYVIHMDPWWNPAAEDQASDRAHRIGQLRPVTIYRLVTEGTIESRIVDLHRHKRDLADSLLEGTEMSGKMSADELLALLQEGM